MNPQNQERRCAPAWATTGRCLLTAAAAVVAVAILPGCGEAEAPESVEVLGTTTQGLTCINLRRAPGAPSVEDAHIVLDPTDPTRASANYGSATALNTGAVGTGQRSALVKFDLSSIPASATITSASLQLAKAQSIGSGPVNLHRVTGSWSESTVTYSSFASAFDSTILASFNPSGASTAISVDVTGLVSGWHGGSYANQGILLAEPANGRMTAGSSESSAAQRPALSVCYAPASCADGIQNGSETGVDCGGPCAPCVNPCANVVCAPLDACHVAGSCNPSTGQCTNPHAQWGTPCDDGNACTQSDTCQSGTCAGANPVVCSASDQCHSAGTCDTATGACSNPAAADGTACSDGNACTSNDVCMAGACAGSGSCGPTGFNVLDTAGVVYNGTNYTVLKVAFAGSDSTGPTWCDDYTDLCAAYGGTPTGCGQPFVGMSGTGYEACATQWDSSGGSESLGCNPSWEVSQAAQAAGFSDATDTNSFGYHWCDSGTCQKTMCTGDYCNTALSYVDLSKAYGYTLCAVAPSCTDGFVNQGETGVDCGGPCGACAAMCGDGIQNSDEDGVDCGGSFCGGCPSAFQVLAAVPLTSGGRNYTVLKVALPASGTANGPTWCDDYSYLCAQFGMAPTGCGDPYVNQANGYGVCASQYGSVGAYDSQSCNPSGSVSNLANVAGFSDAHSGNSFGFHYCDSGSCQKQMCSGAYCNSALSYIDPTAAYSYTVCMTAPSCADGIKNQGETAVDCGGPCSPCPPPVCDSLGPDCGAAEFTTPGTYTFTVPPNVYTISAVAIGGGAVGGQNGISGGAGALSYQNNIPVTPGQTMAVVVAAGGAWYQSLSTVWDGGDSMFASMVAGGGKGGNSTGQGGVAYGGDANFPGGAGGVSPYPNSGGGGTAGYTEAGHDGQNGTAAPYVSGAGGHAGNLGLSGGYGSVPGDSYHGGSGGGTGLYGIASGLLGQDGLSVVHMGQGGPFGGGAGSGGNGYGGTPSTGGGGAVRIVWPGDLRTFPATLVGP
jgi:hypothetical protein